MTNPFLTAFLLSCLLALSASAAPVRRAVNTFAPLAANWGTKGNTYPIIFLHGLMGWGEKPLLNLANYWGGITTNGLSVLRAKGYRAYAPRMGPVSSNWERACEAYAQIVGKKVDYGIARAKQFGHDRFGDDFTGSGFYPEFATCADCKVHLVGHSMGGPTLRTLAHLMAFGSQAEVDACNAAGVPCSPLFYTNKTTSYIKGAVSLSGVHQGSTLADIIASNDGLRDFVLDLVKLLVGVAGEADTSALDVGLWDFQLDHWGLAPRAGEKLVPYITRVLTDTKFTRSKSNALIDLSVQGLLYDPVTNWVKQSPDTVYFSSAALTTVNVLGVSLAKPSTGVFLIPFANLLGAYTNRTLGITGGDWRPNDGLVPIISSRSDVSGYTDYPIDMKQSTSSLARTTLKKPSPGKFNYLGPIDDDHISMVGITDLVGGLRNQYFTNIAGILSSL